MSRVTYDAGTMTITVDGGCGASAGGLEEKDPGGG